MPELPDITIYIERLRERTLDRELRALRFLNPFLLRTFDPKPAEFVGKQVRGIERIGKRIVFEFEDALFLAMHLMKAGRLKWIAKDAKLPGKISLLAMDFDTGTLVLTEAGTKRRASVHLFRSRDQLSSLNAGGIEVMTATDAEFASALTRENHTLKRVLTDPHVFAGIGNAYSDEILHRAKISPLAQSKKIGAEEIVRLFVATKDVLNEWTARLRDESKGKWPEKVTAFREGMAVHGRFKQPCPVCQAPVQRIVYAENETNYCPRCQTGDRILADRAMSRLLKDDWPRNLDELEQR